MYEYFDGRITSRKPTHAVLDVNGVGYLFCIPLSTYDALPSQGNVRIFAHLHVQEDSMRLFGFATEKERELFRLLNRVSGIGPMTALNALSSVSVDQLVRAIAGEDMRCLKAVRGLGAKKAQRIILELKDVLGLWALAEAGGEGIAVRTAANDAILALVSLGFTRAQSEAAVKAASGECGDPQNTGDLIKNALKHV
jgi:Holliday junction DNA helicase RuvA